MSGAAAYECRIPDEPAYVGRLRMLAAAGRVAFDHWRIDLGHLVLVLSAEEVTEVRAAGVPVETGPDLEPLARGVRAERQPRTRDAVDTGGIATGFVDQYLDSGELYARFAALQAEFPALATWSDLPELTSGYDGAGPVAAGPRPVKVLRINSAPAGPVRPGLLLMTGMHAREWAPPLGALEFAEQLLRNYDPASADPAVQAIVALVDGLDILIVPAVNPDGIDWSHHDAAMWRKNRRPPPLAGCPGVDLNRNFSVYWGQAGSSADSCSDVHHGPSAFSEPETRNLRALAEQFPNVWVAVDCHSFGEKIFRPQPTGGTFTAAEPVDPADDAIYQTLEAAINAGVDEASPGKTYMTGTTSNHAGTTDEYLFFTHRMFAFDLECGLSFQPPIATAIVSALEVAAAMRALGRATLDLPLSFPAPAALAQVIDRSGSMVAAGYVDATRANARRLVDLLSTGDHVGVVSFSDAAVTEFPLTPLSDAGVAAAARDAIDGVVFGGWTSIGAGLETAGAMLAAAGVPASIVLLSDGYQNRPPDVATVLTALPAGVRVFAIALGPLSDAVLLESIATATGGQFYFAPDELALHEIYSHVRADISGDGLVMNDAIETEGGTDDPEGEWREVPVESAVSELTVSMAWDALAAVPDIELVPPAGGAASVATIGWILGVGYAIARVPRPKAGTWRLRVRASDRLRVVAAAFVRSRVRVRITEAHGKDGVRLAIGMRRRKRTLPITRVASMVVGPLLGRQSLDRLEVAAKLPGMRAITDAASEDAARLGAARAVLARLPGGDPLAYARTSLRARAVSRASNVRMNVRRSEALGPRSVRLRVEAVPRDGGPPVVRLVMRSFS